MDHFYNLAIKPPMTYWEELEYDKKHCDLLNKSSHFLLKGAKNININIQEAQEKQEIISQTMDGKHMNYTIPNHLTNQYYELTIQDDISLYHINFIENNYYSQQEIDEMNHNFPPYIKKLTQYYPIILNYQNTLSYSQNLKNLIYNHPKNIETYDEFLNLPNGFAYFVVHGLPAKQSYFGKVRTRHKIGTIDKLLYVNILKKCNQ